MKEGIATCSSEAEHCQRAWRRVYDSTQWLEVALYEDDVEGREMERSRTNEEDI